MVSTNSIYKDINDCLKISTETNTLNKYIKVIDSLNKLDLKSDALAILTEGDVFQKLDYSKSKVFDGRNILMKSEYSIGK